MTVDLGIPQLPPEPLTVRRTSRQIMVGKGSHAVPVGGGAPVSVQSMTTTLTADVNATLQQIAELTATGCQIVRAASAAGVPIRIGVNAGSLDKRLLAKHGKATAEALVESALWECSLFEEHGFTDIKISVKHHDPVVMINAYRLLAQRCDYP